MAKDRFRYFRREATEILEQLTRGFLDLEKGGAGNDGLGEILRLAHTLKGAAGVVQLGAVAENAHQIEELFEKYRDHPAAVPAETVDAALGLLDAVRKTLAEVEQVGGMEKSSTEPTSDRAFETIRMEAGEIETLLEGISEAAVQTDALRRIVDSFFSSDRRVVTLIEELDLRTNAARGRRSDSVQVEQIGRITSRLRQRFADFRRGLEDATHRIEREISAIRDQANDLRLVPAGVLFSELERATRDAARSIGKNVAFEGSGGKERLDANVLAGVRTALLHAVRNAVVHGIEDEDVRKKAGKPAEGRVTIRVKRRGHRVSFQCRDDGRGIDLESVRRACVERGLMSQRDAREMGVEQALRVIFDAGTTTTDEADTISGRGVGLDVVRDVAARLKGQVQARSEPGHGMVVEMIVPISLSLFRTLVVEQGKTRTSVPFSAVRRVLRLEESDVATSEVGDSVLFDGQVIPLGTLSALTGEASSRRGDSRFLTALVVEANSGTAALAVDRLLGARDEVVKPNPRLAGDLPAIAGASFDSEGHPNLILDPEGIVKAIAKREKRSLGRPPERNPPILVVDDSLTTRMLERTILEANGYEVGLAGSGGEGLCMLKQRTYGLCLCDVEMPGIDGFEFLERVRSDADLCDLPVILMTTRNTEEDRRRGLEAGARAYMMKSEFDEKVLLRTIRGLIG